MLHITDFRERSFFILKGKDGGLLSTTVVHARQGTNVDTLKRHLKKCNPRILAIWSCSRQQTEEGWAVLLSSSTVHPSFEGSTWYNSIPEV
jgi:hypothetical protein